MECVLKTAATAKPVTLEEVKAVVGLETDQTQFDSFIEALIDGAVNHFEQETNRALMEQTWNGYEEDWPEYDDYIEVWKPPLISVTSIKYTDSSGSVNTWANTEYVVDSQIEPGRVYLGYLKSFPTATLQPASNAINIEFKAGYQKLSEVPFSIKTVLKLLIEFWFTNRGETKEIPVHIKNSIMKFKVHYL